MKIYQVEELVGITKKNIRFYEEQKLLCPKRNPENDYREYSLEDVRQLATKRMVDEATALGADAIVGVRYGSSAVMQGAAEIVAYGTAVKFR